MVVVGVDGSELSIEGLRWAGDPRRVHGQLLVVTGFDIPWTNLVTTQIA